VTRLTQAPDRAVEAGSAKMSVVGEVKISHAAGELTVSTTTEGVLDFASQRTSSTIEVTQSGAGSTPSQPCRVVTDGGMAYLSVPESERGRFQGKEWLQVDLAAATGIDPSSISADPTASLAYIKGVSEDVEELGAADVRGTPTTHYRFVIPTQKLIEQVGEDKRQQMKAYLDQIGIQEIPYEAWLDEQGRPRRTMFVMRGQDPGLDMTTTMELYDYGQPVDITVPPPDSVGQAPDQQTAYATCFNQVPPG
jgi:hypothetical protein